MGAPSALLLLCLSLVAAAPSAPAASSPATTAPWWRREHLVPAPASVALGDGRLALSRAQPPKLVASGLRSTIVDAALARFLPLAFGGSVVQCRLPPCNVTRACNATRELGRLARVEVNLTRAGGNWSGLAHGSDESYRLAVTEAGAATVTAPTAAGAVHGLETLAQLLKQAADGSVALCTVPVAIDDAPRFAWRGMMIDCSRHFLPVPLIKRMVDALSAAKGNVLHWHFMDGQR